MNLKNSLSLALALGLLAPAFQSAAFADDQPDEVQRISVLQAADSSPQQKDAACVWLKHHGTAQSVPALAVLLNDEQLSQSARYALESMPGPEPEKALIAALPKSSGVLKAGIIHSLAVRRDAGAVPALAKLLADPDATVAGASALALGNIASLDAVKALERQLKTGNPAPDAIIDGCLRCAQRCFLAGDSKRALAIDQMVFGKQTKEFFHVAAFRGIVIASGPKGVDKVADAIANGPASLRMAAIQLVHDKTIAGLTVPVANLLPKLDPLAQADVIDALSQRDDPAAAPGISALAKQGDTATRIAAIAAMGSVGDDQAVPPLVEIASTTTGAVQSAARLALNQINHGTPDKALMDLLAGSKPESQAEIARALNKRGTRAAVPQLLQLAGQSGDPVRQAALDALGHLADQSQVPAFVQVVVRMSDDAGRTAAADALALACRHIQSHQGSVDLSPILDALKNGSAETRVALLPVCSGVLNPEVGPVIRDGLADSNPAIHTAAVRALCRTINPALLPDIAKLAAESSDDDTRSQAIEACVRLTTQDPDIHVPGPERLKYFKVIVPAASTISEKRMALSGLSALPELDALNLAVPFLSDATVSNEAAVAVIGICRQLPDTQAAKGALEDLTNRVSDNQTRQDAQETLKRVNARVGYITAWQYAGPYHHDVHDFKGLFNIKFPPETPDAAMVDWQTLPISDDPATPWAMDFLKVIGGDEMAAYARTSIHSDTNQTVWLYINSASGAKAWLNGKVVDSANEMRGLDADPDKVEVTFKAGWNNMMVKITQNVGPWAFGVRVAALDGSQVPGLQFSPTPHPDNPAEKSL